MVLENKFGPTVHVTKVSGKIIKLMERGLFGMWMEMYLKEIGRTIKQTVMVCIIMEMEQSMKDIGKMICNMGMVLSHG